MAVRNAVRGIRAQASGCGPFYARSQLRNVFRSIVYYYCIIGFTVCIVSFVDRAVIKTPLRWPCLLIFRQLSNHQATSILQAYIDGKCSRTYGRASVKWSERRVHTVFMMASSRPLTCTRTRSTHTYTSHFNNSFSQHSPFSLYLSSFYLTPL